MLLLFLLPLLLLLSLFSQVTSSAKKKRDPRSSTIHQTPEGAFYDLQRNAWQVQCSCLYWFTVVCAHLAVSVFVSAMLSRRSPRNAALFAHTSPAPKA
jgi:hypothetical protein